LLLANAMKDNDGLSRTGARLPSLSGGDSLLNLKALSPFWVMESLSLSIGQERLIFEFSAC